MRPTVTLKHRGSVSGPRTRTRVRIVLALALMLASFAAPGAAQAGPSAFTFYATIGSSCIAGIGPVSSPIVLTLMDRDNVVIDTETVQSDSNGNWDSNDCFWFGIYPTDKIRAAVGPTSRTLQIPDITVNINRVSDGVNGKAPTTGTFQLFTTLCEVVACSGGPNVNVNVAANGTYSRDFTALHNLNGGDRAFGRWTSPSGDVVDSQMRTAPYMSLIIGDPVLRGQARPGQAVTASLRTAGGTLVGSGTDTVSKRFPSISLDLRNSSDLPAYPRSGHKVASNIASDASMTIPTITLTMIDADTVSGHCFNNGSVYVYLEYYDSGYHSTDVSFTANAAGNFTVNMADTDNPSYLPPAGSRWEVDCQNAKGDMVARYSRFP